MKKKTLLLVSSLFISMGIIAADRTVTSAAATGEGSLSQVLADAGAGDVINFNVDAEELVVTTVINKGITIDGLNQHNNQKMILKKTTTNFASIKDVELSLKNIIFDGESVVKDIGITAAAGSTLTIEDCVFRNIDSGTNNGGAARIQGTAVIKNTLFESNTAAGGYGGGALCIYNVADVTIESCSFIGNSSTNTGADSGGGAIVARGTATTPCKVSIVNSTFANNSSSKRGGALLASVQSGSNFKAEVKVINCTFTGNVGESAIHALTPTNGESNLWLVNSIVSNNIDASTNDYMDIMETGTVKEGSTGTAKVELYNSLYVRKSESIDVAGRNCIVVENPETANLFATLEDFSTENTKKRPVVADKEGVKVVEISSSGMARNAGIASLEGFAIPATDQLGNARPETPAAGAVEPDESQWTNLDNTHYPEIAISHLGSTVLFTGLDSSTRAEVYNLTGALVHAAWVSNVQPLSMEGLQSSIYIIRVQNNTFKIIHK